MIILTDVDGVLADLVADVCAGLAARGHRRTPEEVTHFDFALSFSAEEMRHVHEIMSAPFFCYGLPWYEGAREFVRDLQGQGEVHAVTAPFRSSPSWMHERVQWLAPAVPAERVHFVGGQYKHLVRGDVLIEDHPGNAAAWCDAHPSGVAILLDRPWNRPTAKEFWPHSRMFRARSYAEALQILRECA